ncbi:MAG: metal-dependent hydrolase [Leptospiraceae bacterium]|nr:metal-dependent hydrolase [Leptospiraceae bacterium]
MLALKKRKNQSTDASGSPSPVHGSTTANSVASAAVASSQEQCLEGNVRMLERRVPYGAGPMDRHWFAGNIAATHVVNSLHMIFPDGERFFIRSVNHYRKQIQNPELKKQVRLFMAQEVQHGVAHERAWDTLRAQGFPVDDFLKKYNHYAYDKLESFVNRRIGHWLSLSTTVALEHYTATLAQAVFDSKVLEYEMPEDMRNLLYWHACEEIEHKAVAFDVMQDIKPGYFKRIAEFIMATFQLLGFTALGVRFMVKADPEAGFWRFHRDFFRFLRKGGLRFFLSLPFKLLDYLRPGFHPDDHQNRMIAAERLRAQGLPV